MNQLEPTFPESDPHFPSGAWTGFYLQQWLPGRHEMKMHLAFEGGAITGKGTDEVGPFRIEGEYDLESGQCRWTKRYIGRHKVTYQGQNEGKGIWGVWEIRQLLGFYRDRSVFHIWPEGMTLDGEDMLTERAAQLSSAGLSGGRWLLVALVLALALLVAVLSMTGILSP